VLIAQASCALIAVGGQFGTLFEIAFGLLFEKPVSVLEDAPDVPGTHRLPGVAADERGSAGRSPWQPDAHLSAHR
jgi:hypothetical protein